MEKTIANADLTKKVHSDTELKLSQFTYWLASLKSMTVVFDECEISNYWK
jgi:hypothetical protein